MLVEKNIPERELMNPIEPISTILEKKLGSDWNISYSALEGARIYSFGLATAEQINPSDEWIAKIYTLEGEFEVHILSKSIMLEGKDRESLRVAIDLAAMSIFTFRDPLMCLKEDLIRAGIFYLNPNIWSDPYLVGNSLSEAFSLLSEKLGLMRRYNSFVRSLHFLSQLNHLPEIMSSLKSLAVLGIEPPLSKGDLFYIDQLSPIEIKVITALSAKEAIDRLHGLDAKRIVSLLSDLMGLSPESFDRRKLLKSISQRELKEGLTLSEISHVLGIDKAYLWRSVLPRMIDRFLLTVSDDVYRGKVVKTYRPNVSLPPINDMVLSFSLNLSYLVRGQT